MIFSITREDVAACLHFAKEAWKNSSQSGKDFGTIERQKKEFIADQTEGKLAEIVFQKYLSSKEIKCELDFNHYEGKKNTDNGDFKIITKDKIIEPKIDIKGSTSLAKWLLVEDYKFINKTSNEFVSNAFIMIGFGKSFPKNKLIRENPEILLDINISGELIGWAFTEDFIIESNKGVFWFTWPKGTYPWKHYILPETKPSTKDELDIFVTRKTCEFDKQGKPSTISVPLKAKINYALPTKWLRTDWEMLINLITESSSPLIMDIKKDRDLHVQKNFFTKGELLDQNPKYSFVFHTKSIYITAEYKMLISHFLYSGIKVILLTDNVNVLNDSLREQINDFKSSKLLQVHETASINLEKKFVIVDGNYKEISFEKYALNFNTFNFEQYEIEHAPASSHLAVKAGAGTGKTTVMIQRVICLMQRDSINPREIAMITFTRDSANEMYSKLREELFKRYYLTTKKHYLIYIEDLKKMNISTIHSFAKKILRDTGSHLGFGREVQVRKFLFDRKQIIESALEKYFDIHEGKFVNLPEKIAPFQLYELVDIINKFWGEFEKKGMAETEISTLEWGLGIDHDKSTFFNNLFKFVFPMIEKEFQQYKLENNSVSLNDLTRQVDIILREAKTLENPLNKFSLNIKYLFIDEFQDSDDVQIRLITQINQALGTRIFAVGDIKQSIYRFRGADHTAFERLEEEFALINEQIITKPLQQNYRTTKQILERLHMLFKYWGDQKWLSYGENDQLFGKRNNPLGLSSDSIFIKEVNLPKEDLEAETINLIIEAKNKIKSDLESNPKNRKIAALVRTNREARLLEYWSKKNNIDIYLNIGGTFFNSVAVRDFYALIEALLFPSNPTSIINLLSTPYSNVDIRWTEIADFKGNEETIYSFLKNEEIKNASKNDGISNSLPLNLSGWVDQIRISPLFSVLRKIIKDTQVQDRYLQITRERLSGESHLTDEELLNKADLMQRQYVLNLNHLMDLFHREFTSDFVTLNQIHTWLKRNRATNREEDEPILNDIPEDVLNIITVHRSKGLEYHTVLIPFTERVFRYKSNEILINKTKDNAGWQLKKKTIIRNRNNTTTFSNDFYSSLDKDEELFTLQEEVRLLYVALTRTKNQIFILKNTFEKFPSSAINNWNKTLNSTDWRM